VFNSIKSLYKIQFDDHNFLFGLLTLVNILKISSQTVLNGPRFDESILVLMVEGIIIVCSLSLNSLVMILTMLFSNEIDLKSLTPTGEFTFGTKVMKELLIAYWFILSSKKSK
jgi:hypothetical protein